MNESNSIQTTDRTNLTEQTKTRLDKITEIENYFYKEINQRKSCSKKLSKYVAAFDYIDKVLIGLSADNRRSIYLFLYERCWSSCRNSKCKFYSNLSSNNRNSQKIIKKQQETKRKSMIKFLCWLKVNAIALKL